MRNNIFATGGTAKRFAKGVAISGPQVSNTVLIASQVNLIRTDGNNDYNPGGPLGGGGTGYFGFKNMANGKTYYGWMRVQVMVDNRGYPSYIRFLNTPDGIFGAYASKDDPQWVGGAFKVGDSYTGVVPEPSTLALEGLGLLALGAAGVREMRRRRQTEAAA